MANLIEPGKTILVIVDLQEKILEKIPARESVVDNTLKLIEYAKLAQMPIIVTEHYSKGMGYTVKEIMDAIPKFLPIDKTTFSCFGEEEFLKALHLCKRFTLIIAGVETHGAVCQTALDATDTGKYRTLVPADATASQEEIDWKMGLERMKMKRVELASTDMLILEMLKRSQTEEYEAMLPFLRKKPKRGEEGLVYL